MKNERELTNHIQMKSISEIAGKLNLTQEEFEMYGNYKAKVYVSTLNRLREKEDGKLVVVTSINPTPVGEGKTTVTIGLADAMTHLGKKAIIALREPSMGPFMGIKGGGTGGGLAQVVPTEDINLHFTGDIHAVTTANNTLSAIIDNHIYHGNELNFDPRRIIWKRTLDINDRALRHTTIGLGGVKQGVPREEGFDSSVASEIMAVLCLAKNHEDLKQRLRNMIVGYTFQSEPLTVGDLKMEGALTLILKNALHPNLVQTMYHTPALIHGGPFANIAHGCNSVVATKLGLKLSDIVITEAGFGADLGAEKFFDIKVPILEKEPDAIVIVATIRALKMHGGVEENELSMENLPALKSGMSNLGKHISNMKKYGVPVVIALNEFLSDTAKEVLVLKDFCEYLETPIEVVSVWEKGYEGGLGLAEKVLSILEEGNSQFEAVYSFGMTIQEKVETIVKEIYGGEGVDFSEQALEQIKIFEKYGWDRLPICMAKTQYSLSDDPTKLGKPTKFTVTIRELVPKMGAGFIVALTKNMMTMPGLPKKPAALKLDLIKN